jgi:hypothetical protein
MYRSRHPPPFLRFITPSAEMSCPVNCLYVPLTVQRMIKTIADTLENLLYTHTAPVAAPIAPNISQGTGVGAAAAAASTSSSSSRSASSGTAPVPPVTVAPASIPAATATTTTTVVAPASTLSSEPVKQNPNPNANAKPRAHFSRPFKRVKFADVLTQQVAAQGVTV